MPADKKSKQSRLFADFVDTLDYVEVCRITVTPSGTFEVPSEREGRVVQVSAATRRSLAKFCRAFADRLDNATPSPAGRK